MHHIHTKAENFTAQHPPLSDFINKIYPEVSLITIKLKTSAHRYLGEQKYYQGLVEERLMGDWVEMDFLSTSLSNFSYWFLGFADVAWVISPDTLRTHLRERLLVMEKNLQIV